MAFLRLKNALDPFQLLERSGPSVYNLHRWKGLIDMRYPFTEINFTDYYHVRNRRDANESTRLQP